MTSLKTAAKETTCEVKTEVFPARLQKTVLNSLYFFFKPTFSTSRTNKNLKW